MANYCKCFQNDFFQLIVSYKFVYDLDLLLSVVVWFFFFRFIKSLNYSVYSYCFHETINISLNIHCHI